MRAMGCISMSALCCALRRLGGATGAVESWMVGVARKWRCRQMANLNIKAAEEGKRMVQRTATTTIISEDSCV
jgi:hypothetical protein